MKICYINFKLDNPRDEITIKGLRDNGVIVREIFDQGSKWRKYLTIAKKYYASKKDNDAVIVGFAGAILVIFLRLFTRERIIYNTLSSFYDSMIISRFGGSVFSVKSIFYYLIDFVAFRCANHIFVETKAQKDLIKKIYHINPSKMSVQYVGVNDGNFYFDPKISKLNQFTVIFRGAFLPEAGADILIRASKELEKENIGIRILGRGLCNKDINDLINILKPKNVIIENGHLSLIELRRKMQECHLSIGQLANHPRVHRTIPHKLFESMIIKLPYLSGHNNGILEILKDKETCFTIPPGDYHALARKIIELKQKPQELKRVSENAYKLYLNCFTPKLLTKKMIEFI